eukprot:TRINITY_DN426_c0_g1_i11.p4 TRINITY_DN426_c0_g1~~TRINITY_DN426_c0_g1_i11.p4  ORF type:complete len:137 (-),score=33.03 TRINITY_DN426_c0_g1_i11:1277-1687(-)
MKSKGSVQEAALEAWNQASKEKDQDEHVHSMPKSFLASTDRIIHGELSPPSSPDNDGETPLERMQREEAEQKAIISFLSKCLLEVTNDIIVQVAKEAVEHHNKKMEKIEKNSKKPSPLKPVETKVVITGKSPLGGK